MAESELAQLSLQALKPGRWYVGRGRNNNVALWDGQMFLTIGFEFGIARVKLEPYWFSIRDPNASPENYGTFQPFLEVNEGALVEAVDPDDGAVYSYAKRLAFATEIDHDQ